MSGIQWVWAFLDEPRASFEEALTYWSALTRTTASPRRGADDEFLTLLPRLGAPWLKMQATGSGRGIHLDLDVERPRAAAHQALALGARELATLGDDQVVILASPAGFVFCFTRYAAPPGLGSAHPEAPAPMTAQVRVGEPDLVDQVCLDIPDSAYAREVDFWAALSGWQPLPNTRAEFTALRRPDGIPIRLLLQRLGESAGPARAHLDLACADRNATLARHTARGATIVGGGPRWTILRDPLGRTYCLTDRDPDTGRLPSAP